MRYSTDKDCQEQIEMLVKLGWVYSAGSKHGKLIAPNGKLLVFSRTPSDWRSSRNLMRDARRICRAFN